MDSKESSDMGFAGAVTHDSKIFSLEVLATERFGHSDRRANGDRFPWLERLFVKVCWYLDSIPQDFSEITTFEQIRISGCAQSIGNSAKQIQQDIVDNHTSSLELGLLSSISDEPYDELDDGQLAD
ncbi:hypothetical protein RND71_016607 [Anisodus tanguticus]|uniref:Uncharacterized protein n=1 Tax=Anisodus tanguticus TaxID=243964 RepID=A0AAE1S6H3_9SOLA|nr:hypothetical protein RND71_016607 [Anisodus tanguticus]